MAAVETERADRELVEWLENREFGSLAIRSVEATRTEDSAGDLALRLVLTAPVGDQPTWELAAVRHLDSAVRDKALALGVEWPWYIELRPDVEEDQEEDTTPDPDRVTVR